MKEDDIFYFSKKTKRFHRLTVDLIRGLEVLQ